MLLKLVHGYTGRKPGDLPGYDAQANGVLLIDELYEIMTKFYIDDYPSERHFGADMGGRRPAEVFKELNRTRKLMAPINEDVRRIHLGWKVEATPNDEGVRVFGGLWYSSNELQKYVDRPNVRKVSVFVDPDNVTEATVVIPGFDEVLRVQLQITAFADLTLPQVLNLMETYRKEAPNVTELHEDRLAKTRRERHDRLNALGVERRLQRSFSTFEECYAKGKAVFAGARIIPSTVTTDTVRAGSIMDQMEGDGIFKIGKGSALIEHAHIDCDDSDREQDADELLQSPNGGQPMSRHGTEVSDAEIIAESVGGQNRKSVMNRQPLGRPKSEGKFK